MCHVNAGRLLKGPPPAGGRAARDHEAILAAANRPVESLRRVASCRQPGSRKPPFKRSQARGLEVDAFAGRKGSTIGPRKPPGHGHWVCSPSVRLSAGRVTNPEAPPIRNQPFPVGTWYQEPTEGNRLVVSGTASLSSTHVVSGTMGHVVSGTPSTWFLEPNLVVSGTLIP